jgi:hypothetical protein
VNAGWWKAASFHLALGVGVEQVELDRPEDAAVVAPRHSELVELVASSVHPHVVVAEDSRDGDICAPRPPEARLPIGVERGRALRVVVVPERKDQVGRVPSLEAADRPTEGVLRLAADAEVAEGDDPDRRGGTGVARAVQHQAGEG